MKLGFWNRLAVAASGLALVFGPIAMLGIDQAQRYGSFVIELKYCEDSFPTNVMPGYEHKVDASLKCSEESRRRFLAHTSYTWSDWSECLIATAILCAVVYGLIFAVVAVIKWVWLGRLR